MRIRAFFMGLAAACSIGTAAASQQILAEYWTLLGRPDMYNSSGARLTDFCAIVQQDRANYHRFGRAEPSDGGEPFFARRANRAQMSGKCRVQTGFEYIYRDVLSGTPRYIWVRVYGSGGRISEILINEGAG